MRHLTALCTTTDTKFGIFTFVSIETLALLLCIHDFYLLYFISYVAFRERIHFKARLVCKSSVHEQTVTDTLNDSDECSGRSEHDSSDGNGKAVCATVPRGSVL